MKNVTRIGVLLVWGVMVSGSFAGERAFTLQAVQDFARREAEVHDSASSVETGVEESFLRLQFLELKLRGAYFAIQVAQDFLRIARLREEAGTVPELDVVETETEWNRALADREKVEIEVIDARLHLANLLGCGYRDLEISGSLEPFRLPKNFSRTMSEPATVSAERTTPSTNPGEAAQVSNDPQDSTSRFARNNRKDAAVERLERAFERLAILQFQEIPRCARHLEIAVRGYKAGGLPCLGALEGGRHAMTSLQRYLESLLDLHLARLLLAREVGREGLDFKALGFSRYAQSWLSAEPPPR